MTCVVGLEHSDGTVYVAGDRAAVRRDPTGLGATTFVWGEPKVFARSGFVFGFCGSFRVGQVLRHVLRPRPHRGSERDLTAHLVTVFASELRAALRDAGTDMGERGTGLLIGWRGILHRMESNMQVSRASDGFAAIGLGEPLALGALHALAGFDLAPRKRLSLALAAAEHYNVAVRGPFDTVRTRRRP